MPDAQTDEAAMIVDVNDDEDGEYVAIFLE